MNILKTKIHFGFALLIIAAFSVVPIALNLILLFDDTHHAEAFGSGVGVRIIAPPIKCVQDTLSPTCFATCQVCGDLAGICNGLFEIKAQHLSGLPVLHKGLAFCTAQPIPPNGGVFRPGSLCLGNVLGQPIHKFNNFGCSY